MIKLKVLESDPDRKKHRFNIIADEPVYIESEVLNDETTLYVYPGLEEPKKDQNPVVIFDSDCKNNSMIHNHPIQCKLENILERLDAGTIDVAGAKNVVHQLLSEL